MENDPRAYPNFKPIFQSQSAERESISSQKAQGKDGVQGITDALCALTGHCAFCKLLLVKTLFNLHFKGSLIFLRPHRRELCLLPVTRPFISQGVRRAFRQHQWLSSLLVDWGVFGPEGFPSIFLPLVFYLKRLFSSFIRNRNKTTR